MSKLKLPTGWSETTLDDVAIWSSGGTPSRSNPIYYSGTIPWFKTGELGPRVLSTAEEHISDEAVRASSAKVFPKGSVALAMYGATIGRTSIFGIDAATNQACAVGRPDATNSDFLYYFLASQEKWFIDAGKGGAQPNISQGIVKAWPISLPPRAEQSRIVAKLEELLSDLDAGVAELKAAQKKLARYRQSLLKAAVEGSLTEAWRAQHTPTETGAQLLQRILTERRARWEAKQLAKFKEQGKAPPKDWQKNYPEPVRPDTAGLPQLPIGWVWASLGQLLAELTSGSRDWAPFYDKGSCVFVMAQNVRPWRPDFSLKQYVDPPLDHRDRVRSEVQMDDLLTTIVGANTGQVCRVSNAVKSHFVCQSVALLRLVLPNMAEYVNAVLNSEGHGQRQFREMNYGAGRPHLSFDQLESVVVPLPSLNEQVQIMEVVSESLVAYQQVDSELLELAKKSTAQRQNILRAAFAGQLVPQDPNDEPASVLLARIRAERAERVAGKKPRGRKAKGAQA